VGGGMMKSKKDIDRDYYLRNREKILERVAKYQKENPEIHRKAARKYERNKNNRKDNS
jgi:hypothetical protein